MDKKQILILGSLGMLGQELTKLFSSDATYEVYAWDKEDIDITNFPQMKEKLMSLKPAIVINATGYNAVDKCEKDDEEFRKALLLNRDVPAFLAEESVNLGFLLVHYSTDYVFDGMLEQNLTKEGCCGGGCCQSAPGSRDEKIGYNEDALPHPLSRYGESKYLGEQRLKEKAKRYYLIRLSKLFGKPGSSAEAKRSFFETMLEVAKTKNEVEVVNEEKSAFTYAPDLAEATKGLIESESEYGVYHLTNTGSATWYEAVIELYKTAGIATAVVPVGSESFPRPARRPACSTLINSKQPLLRSWQEALKEYLQEK